MILKILQNSLESTFAGLWFMIMLWTDFLFLVRNIQKINVLPMFQHFFHLIYIFPVFFRSPLIFSLKILADSELCQTSKMEFFAKIVNNLKPGFIFVKTPVLDIWQVSKYSSRFYSLGFSEKLMEISVSKLLLIKIFFIKIFFRFPFQKVWK